MGDQGAIKTKVLEKYQSGFHDKKKKSHFEHPIEHMECIWQPQHCLQEAVHKKLPGNQGINKGSDDSVVKALDYGRS